MSMLRSAGLALHRCFMWNGEVARAYASAWRLLLFCLPECRLRAHLVNNLIAADWSHDSLGTHTVELADGVRARFKPRPGSLAMAKAAFRRRIAHEPEVFDFLTKRRRHYDAVIEIGANVGVYTLLFGKYLVRQDDINRVFSFEPSRKAYADLLEHLRINGITNVVTFNCAVAPGPRLASFYENHQDLMKGTLNEGVAPLFPGGGILTTTTMVAGFEEVRALVQDFDRVLLKLDVVGSEPAVLSELQRTISEKAPEIVIGVWNGNLEGLNAIPWLRSRYRLFRIDATGLSHRDNFCDQSYCNYFLEPLSVNALTH